MFTDKLTYVDFQRQWPNMAYPKGSVLDDLIKQGGILKGGAGICGCSGHFTPAWSRFLVHPLLRMTGVQGATGGAPQVPAG